MHARRKALPALTLAASGVVFGDIGTSPLYALKEIFNGHHPIAVTPDNVLGVLSMVFWSIMVLVTLKYVLIMMRADNRGEGGSLALLALILERARSHRLAWLVSMLGIFAAALFFGDSMITPAISVLSAVEGIGILTPDLDEYVVPLTLAILTALFMIQRRGTAAVGLFFGRVGNFINGELYGRATTVPWGMVFPDGGPLPRHPSQLYEAGLEGIVLFLILWPLRRLPWTRPAPRRWPHGTLLSLFLGLYGLFRFVVEFFREPDSQLGLLFLHLSMGQLLCLVMLAVAALLWHQRKTALARTLSGHQRRSAPRR